MIRRLVKEYGSAREKASPVAGFKILDGEPEGEVNVIAAIGENGEFLFNFAWRPHKPSPKTNHYTREGLFFC